MKQKLYIVRHGQTLFNKKERIQGRCDSPLTDLGHRQAKATKDYFEKKGVRFDYAACSSLHRTEETLKDITDLPYDRYDGLMEFSYGNLEGEPTAVVKGKPIDLETFYKKQGGESATEVEDRMEKTVNQILKDNPDKNNLLLVSHGSASYRLAHRIDPKKAKASRKFANCVIYEYDVENGKLALKDIIDEHVKDVA